MRKDKPSRTAAKVALNVVTLGAEPSMGEILPPGIVEATERLLVASGVARPRLVRWARTRTMVSVYRAFDWMLPGQFEAFGYRKAFCERQVRHAIAAGATQVLVLGAGYDTLGWRLAPELSGVSFFEIDHPATARSKSKGIVVMGERDNLHLITEDLGKRKLVDVLRGDDSWDQNARTIIVAEGLLMYLSHDAVRDMFCQCAAITGAGSRSIFSYIPTGADGRPDAGPCTGLLLWLQNALGEPWTWSIRPEQLSRFLADTGWTSAPELMDTVEQRGVERYGVAVKSP